MSDKLDLDSLFQEAIRIDSDEARAEFVRHACGTNEEIKRELEQLLQSDEVEDSFLEQPALGPKATMIPRTNGDSGVVPLDAGSADEAVVLGDANHSVLNMLGNTLNEVPRVSLRESVAEGEGPIARPTSSEMPDRNTDNRFRLDGEIARGGMGAIIKGRDTDLGRDLAIKVLLDSHKDKPEVIQRFIEEAQIGGQLQHPGIAPIYELGQFADKRPFFAMKLVKGQTLSKLLADREDATEGRGQLIGIFEQICQTMAYAHSRGVIHRDLKPANIMVGAFGEVQVMDWGLAKVLSAGGVADEKKAHDTQQGQSIIQTLRSQTGSDTPGTFGTGGSQTQMGSVMGTPAYMPPEQALGEIDNMDERADVFGLGAILTEILTGKPPYVATDKMDVFRQASRGKLDDCMQRLDACGADEELRALTKRCLNLEPSDRPRDAGVLAEQVKEYLESVDTRLRLAELDRVEATTRVAEERKRRKVIMALAASVMLAFGIAAGGWVWMKQKDVALAQARAQAEITAQVRRGQLEQQVAGELSTARTLATVDPGELPTQSSLDRATAALDRSENLLHTGEVDDAIEQDVLDLRIELDQMGSDRKLIAALEDCWRLEIEHRIASREEERVTSAPSLAEPALGDDQSQMGTELTEEVELGKQLGKPAQAYAAAFLDWGVVPTETTQEEMAQRLSRLPESVRASVLVSLVRWRAQLLTDKTLAQWQAAPWSTLEPIELTSRGGDKLEVLDGKSILASGENAHMGYDLTFETDTTDLSGMRLEALTHESLPNHGPGRSVLGGKRYDGIYSRYTGVFSLGGLKVWYAPRNAPHQRQRLWFRAAVADYNKSGATDSSLTTENWQIDEGSGKDHVAFFTPRDPPHCEEGFIVTISHEDREKGLWGDQNIGHFRWSVNSNKAEESTIEWLVQAAAENDDDAWRRELRLEIERGDVTSLIHRARDTDSFADQPRIVLAQLAEDLLSNSSASLLSMVEDSDHWNPFSADQRLVGSTNLPLLPYEPTDAVVVETQNDGSYVISGSGETSAFEQLTLTGPVSNTPYAIKLELIPHPSDGGSTFGRGLGGWVELVDVIAELVDDVEPKTRVDLDITQVMSDLPTDRPLRHNDITDNDRQTFCPCYDGGNRHAIVFMCAAPVEPIASAKRLKYLRLKIRTGGAHRHLARFRLSVLNRPIEVPNPADVALDLMRHVQSQDPNDFWTNLAASEMCLQRPSPLFAEALRYATAAVSLRPSDVGGHASILDVLPIDETTLGSPYGVMAKIHANRLWQLDPENSAIPKLKRSLMTTADQLAETGEREQAISKLKLAANLPVANDLSTLLKLSVSLSSLRDYDSALEACQRVIDINPEQPRAYSSSGYVYWLKGDSENAERMYRKEIELRPDDAGITYSNLASVVAKHDLDEAIELCRRGIESTPTDARIHFRLGTFLGMRGDWEGTAIAFRETIKLPNATAYTYSSVAAFLLTINDEKLRDPKLALELAEKAVELEPDSFRLLTLGIAHYRNGNWRLAVEKLNEGTDSAHSTFKPFFLAMAHWKLDEKDEARHWFDKAVQSLDKNRNGRELKNFEVRAEAEKTLGINTEPVESK